MVGQLGWVVVGMPETKGISPGRMQRELGIE